MKCDALKNLQACADYVRMAAARITYLHQWVALFQNLF